MTRKLLDPLPTHVTEPQRRASDPASSAWVRANAGSGKTHVLTERVMRLLLAGVAPEEILCLTYTKAAAAEMRRRLSSRLADWALLPEPALVERLAAMEGRTPGAASWRGPERCSPMRWRRRAGSRSTPSTPSARSVLHRFPLEAGVPFGFTVIEDVEAEALIRRTREAVIAGGLRGDAATGRAVETLFSLLSDHAMTTAIDAALSQGRKLRQVLADRGIAKAKLRAMVGMPDGETREAIFRRAVEETLFPPARHHELFSHLPPDPGRSRNLRFVDRLWQSRAQMLDGEVRFEIFLKDDGNPYADRRTARITDPALVAAIGGEHDRLAQLYPFSVAPPSSSAPKRCSICWAPSSSATRRRSGPMPGSISTT